jgi:hypothetical protein
MSAWRLMAAACVGAAVALGGTYWVQAARLNAMQAKAGEHAREAQIAREAQSRAQAEAAALRVALDAAATARAELVRKRELHREATKRFGRSLVARSTARMVREAGAAMPRSTPGVGAVLNAGMLALTAVEVCLTLKELTDLYTALEEPGEPAPRFCGVSFPAH